jgi:hypothetical protein
VVVEGGVVVLAPWFGGTDFSEPAFASFVFCGCDVDGGFVVPAALPCALLEGIWLLSGGVVVEGVCVLVALLWSAAEGEVVL